MTVSAFSVPIQPGLVPLPPQPIPSTLQLVYAPTLPALTCQPPLISAFDFGLFGGGSFTLPLLPRQPDPLELAGRALQHLGLQTTPLAPSVTILKCVAALANLAKNLPTDVAQAIAFNPTPLVTDVTAVVAASTDLAALAILPLQLCKMVRGGLTQLISFLQAMKTFLQRLIARYTNINGMIAAAAANAAWLANATCAKERLDAKAAAVNQYLASVGVFVLLLSVLLCLITGGHLPALPTLDLSNLVAEVFDPVIEALTIIRDAIPDISGFALSC